MSFPMRGKGHLVFGLPSTPFFLLETEGTAPQPLPTCGLYCTFFHDSASLANSDIQGWASDEVGPIRDLPWDFLIVTMKPFVP